MNTTQDEWTQQKIDEAWELLRWHQRAKLRATSALLSALVGLLIFWVLS